VQSHGTLEFELSSSELYSRKYNHILTSFSKTCDEVQVELLSRSQEKGNSYTFSYAVARKQCLIKSFLKKILVKLIVPVVLNDLFSTE